MVDSFFWTLVCSCLWLVVAFCIKWFINQQIYYYYSHFASRGRTLLAPRVFHFFLVGERWCCLKDAIHGNPNWDLSLPNRRRRRSRRSKWLLGVVLSLTCFNRIIICYIFITRWTRIRRWLWETKTFLQQVVECRGWMDEEKERTPRNSIIYYCTSLLVDDVEFKFSSRTSQKNLNEKCWLGPLPFASSLPLAARLNSMLPLSTHQFRIQATPPHWDTTTRRKRNKCRAQANCRL